MFMCVYSVGVVLCVGRGLAMGCSPVQGVLPTVYRIKKLKKNGQGPTEDSRSIDRHERTGPMVGLYVFSLHAVLAKNA
jgi:hypothetical protein